MFVYTFKREERKKKSHPSSFHFMEDNEGTSFQTHRNQALFAKKRRKPPPSLYKVVLLNDDFTPMDFVIHILGRFFNQSRNDAERTVLHIHNQGLAEAGTFSHEIAETKVYLVNKYARKHNFPLKCLLKKI